MKYLTVLLVLFISCDSIHQSDDKKTSIGLLPFDNFPSKDLELIRSSIRSEYGVDVYTLASQKIPERFFVNVKSPRYRADSIIAYVRDIKPDSIDVILSLTHKDISMTKRDADGMIKKPESRYTDWGVFGLGYRPGVSCVVSSFRMGKDRSLYAARLQKVSLHEVGHTLGLPHCSDSKCLMVDAAESITTIDKAGDHLCAVCKEKLE